MGPPFISQAASHPKKAGLAQGRDSGILYERLIKKVAVVAKDPEPSFDPKVFLATVNHGRSATRYLAGQTIFSQADPADAVFYVQKGNVKVAVTSEQGKEAVVAIIEAGDFFGEGCLIGQPARLATATAIADSEIMRVEKVEMVRVLHQSPPSPRCS